MAVTREHLALEPCHPCGNSSGQGWSALTLHGPAYVEMLIGCAVSRMQTLVLEAPLQSPISGVQGNGTD